MEDDPRSAFSFVPYSVLHIEDIRVYIHYPIEELGRNHILNLYNNQLSAKSLMLKPKFQGLENKGFAQFIRFSLFYEVEGIWFIFNRVHNEFIWLDKAHNITKFVIQALIGLCAFRELMSLKAVKNDVVNNAIRSKFDKWVMTIKDILEYDIRFASMVIGYKIYYSNKENSFFSTTIYDAYEMMRKNKT